jgi:hypothetical protein
VWILCIAREVILQEDLFGRAVPGQTRQQQGQDGAKQETADSPVHRPALGMRDSTFSLSSCCGSVKGKRRCCISTQPIRRRARQITLFRCSA